MWLLFFRFIFDNIYVILLILIDLGRMFLVSFCYIDGESCRKNKYIEEYRINFLFLGLWVEKIIDFK